MATNVKHCKHETYQRGWSKIWGTYQGSIYLLPTEADRIYVTPNIRQPMFSCRIPGAERQIIVEYPKHDAENAIPIKIKIPDLILSQSFVTHYDECVRSIRRTCYCKRCSPDYHHVPFCHCRTCLHWEDNRIRQAIFKTSFYLSRILPSTQLIPTVQPWRFANVCSGGSICFGTQIPATNMRKANANFWGSHFNNSNGVAGGYIHQNCNLTKHRYPINHWTTHPRFYNCRRKIIHTCSCKCPDKNRHRPFLCNGCRCVCQCSCCINTCSCVCVCVCCAGGCECRCNCRDRDDFAVFLQAISEEIRPNETSWHILSSDTFVWSEKADGIFITSDKDLMLLSKEKPKLFYNDPYIIGFATELSEGEWGIQFPNGESFILSSKEVYLA